MNAKNAALAVLVALVVGFGAYGLTRWLAAPTASDTDEMTWLRREFHLTPAQAEKIEQLHAAYEPVCMEHCMQILTARKQLTALAGSGREDSAEYRQAQADMERLKRVCTEATRQHLETVAAAMSPDEGRRYIELVGPKLSQHEHAQPFGLK
ncbi:MAG TPA: periplasmic heavy metal sensor [Opitutaceae bacterium]